MHHRINTPADYSGFHIGGPLFSKLADRPSKSEWRGNYAGPQKIFVRNGRPIMGLFLNFNISFFDLPWNPAVKTFGFRTERENVRGPPI